MNREPNIIDIEELIADAAPGSEVVAFVSSKSSKERQADFRRAQLAKGLKQVTVWIPVNEAASLVMLAKAMCDNRDLELRREPCRNVSNGQFAKIL